MKNLQLSLLAVAAILFAVSCKKTDARPSSADENPSTVVNSNLDNSASIKWDASREETHTVYSTVIADPAVTKDVVANGLVLVYKINGSSVSGLPFTEKNGSSEDYWYYQVANGAIQISVNSKGEAPSTQNNFKRLVISPDQLSSLQSKGLSKMDLMTSSYDRVSAALSNK